VAAADNAFQRGDHFGSGHGYLDRFVVLQDGLHLVPGRPVDDPFVLAGVTTVLVGDLADIDPVVQQPVNVACIPFGALTDFAFLDGMRKEEILSLQWKNVDLINGFILLDVTKNGHRSEIPINSNLKATFQNIIRRIDTDYVFYEEAIEHVDGKEFRKAKRFGNIRKSFLTACRKANIRDFHFHDLRHCFASHLVMAGVDITSVKELLGHQSLAMTMRYSHLAPSHKVKAVDNLDTTINENTNYKKTIQKERAANA
jgi:integrase